MHYRDGTPAQLGDIVKGQGYNVEGEIVGVVLALKDEESCNITVGYIAGVYEKALKESRFHEAISLKTEYGEAKSFELLYRTAPGFIKPDESPKEPELAPAP